LHIFLLGSWLHNRRNLTSLYSHGCVRCTFQRLLEAKKIFQWLTYFNRVSSLGSSDSHHPKHLQISKQNCGKGWRVCWVISDPICQGFGWVSGSLGYPSYCYTLKVFCKLDNIFSSIWITFSRSLSICHDHKREHMEDAALIQTIPYTPSTNFTSKFTCLIPKIYKNCLTIKLVPLLGVPPPPNKYR